MLGTGSLSMAALLLGVASQEAVATRSNRSEGAGVEGEYTPTQESPREQQRWHQREVKVVLDQSLDQLSGSTATLVEAAFQAWNDTGAELPIVTFEHAANTPVSLKPDGQNTILVAPITFSGHETDLAITVGFSNASSGEISEADIIINSKHLFKPVSQHEAEASSMNSIASTNPQDQESCTGALSSMACGDHYDLQNVLTHEVGHFFGLGENYDDPRTTMFSCTSACEIHKRDLSPLDAEQIDLLYAEPHAERGVGCWGVQIGGHPKHLRLSGWMLGLMLVASLGLRRLHRTG